MEILHKRLITMISFTLSITILASNNIFGELPAPDIYQEETACISSSAEEKNVQDEQIEQTTAVAESDEAEQKSIENACPAVPPIVHNLSISQLQQALFLLDEDLAMADDDEEIAVITAKRDRVVAALKAIGGSTNYSGEPGLLKRKDKTNYSPYYIASSVVITAACLALAMSFIKTDATSGPHLDFPPTLDNLRNNWAAIKAKTWASYDGQQHTIAPTA